MTIGEEFDALARALGFESEAEMHRLIASVCLETAYQRLLFSDWKLNDGTKAGLLRLDREPRS